MIMNPHIMNRRDALLRAAIVLPAANAQQASAVFDLTDNAGAMHRTFELAIDWPACTAAQLPAGKTVAVELQHTDDAKAGDDATAASAAWEPIPAYGGVALTGRAVDASIEGDTGGGALGTQTRWRLPSDVRRYVRAVVKPGSGAALSGLSAEIAMLF